MEHSMQYWEHNNGYAPKYIKRVISPVNLEKSNAYFADLVKEIHSRGMKVVIDGVFNHCGSFNKWLDREGGYLNKKGYKENLWLYLTLCPKSAATSSRQPSTLNGSETHFAPVDRIYSSSSGLCS